MEAKALEKFSSLTTNIIGGFTGGFKHGVKAGSKARLGTQAGNVVGRAAKFINNNKAATASLLGAGAVGHSLLGSNNNSVTRYG
jgi:hypothetical protein